MLRKISKIWCGLFFICTLFLSCQQATTINTVTYKIEYNANGHGTNPKTIEVIENTELSSQLLAPLQDFDGYYCTGWLLDNKPISEGYKITNDIKLTAIWEKYLTVNYIDSKGNKIWPLKNIKLGHLLTDEQLPKLLDQANINFKGWYIGDTHVTTGFKVVEDITLTAVWGESYTVSFKDDKTSYYNTERGLKYGDSINVPSMNKEVEGYTFDGWYNGTTKINTASIKVDSDLTIVAKWTPIKYSIEYILGEDGLSNTNPKEYTIEDEIIFNEILREGYIFKGLYSDATFSKLVTGIPKGNSGNKKYYAKWIEDGNVGEISSLDIRNTTNVCSSIISFNTEAPVSRTLTANKKELKTLTYFENGNTKPFIFTTSRNKKVLLSVSDIVQISDFVIAIKYDSIWKVITIFDNPLNSDKDITISLAKDTPNSQALVNLKTGEYFDFNDYQLKNMTSSKDYIIAFGKNGKEAKTLYKIDINNITTAVPLNNANFDPLDSNNKIYSWGNDLVCYYRPNDNSTMYHLKEDIPPFTFNNSPNLNQNLKGAYMHFTFMEDDIGNIYAFSISESDFHYYITAKVVLGKDKRSLAYESIKEYPIADSLYIANLNFSRMKYNLVSANIYLPCDEVLYETTEHIELTSECVLHATILNNELSISIKNTVLDLQPWGDNSLIYNNTSYYLKYGHIYSANYDTMKPYDIFSSNNLISDSNNKDIRLINVVDDHLIFYQRIGATKVGTYSIPINELSSSVEPKLIAEHKSDIKDIVYLNF